MDLASLFYSVGIIFMIMCMVLIGVIIFVILSILKGVKETKDNVTSTVKTVIATQGSMFTSGLLLQKVIMPAIFKFFKKK